MIFPIVNHFFDAKFPVLEDHEEEILFPHPTWPGVQANQLGAIYFDEDLYTVVIDPREQFRLRRKGESNVYCLGLREKVAMECYTGRSFKGYNFFHIDGNPLNTTFENLVFFVNKGKGIDEYQSRKKAFIRRTLDYMKTREPLIKKRGIEPIDYWSAMNLPDWIMYHWKSENGFPVPPKRKTYPTRSYTTGDAQIEVIERLKELKAAGSTQQDIMEILEIKSVSRYKYLLKKTKARFDI